jgi:CHASE2 domain-containing sensor protein
VQSDLLDKAEKRTRPYITSRSGSLTYAYFLAVLAGSLLLSLLLDPDHARYWWADLVTSGFSTRLERQHQSIVLVYVSAATLADYADHPYLSPIDRQILAQLIEAVDQAGAKVIGLDIVLDRRTELNKDKTLRETIRHTKAKMVLGAIDEPENGSQGEFFCVKADGNDPDIGHVYFDAHHRSLVVSDHVIRFIEPLPEAIKLPVGRKIRKNFAIDLPCRGEIHESFAEAMAHASGVDFRPKSPYIDWVLPPNYDKHHHHRPQYKALILPTRYDVASFPILTAEDALAKLPDASHFFRDKIVIIGGDFDNRDQHLTPLSVSRDDFYKGPFIHAQILAQILDKRSIVELESSFELLVALVSGFAGYWCGRRSRHFYLWADLFGVLSLFIISFLAFWLCRIMFPEYWLLFWLVGSATGHYTADWNASRMRESAKLKN